MRISKDGNFVQLTIEQAKTALAEQEVIAFEASKDNLFVYEDSNGNIHGALESTFKNDRPVSWKKITPEMLKSLLQQNLIYKYEGEFFTRKEAIHE